MKVPRRAGLLFVSLLAVTSVLPAARADAGLKLDRFKSHISFGYSKVASDSLAPGGSLSAGAGIQYPLGEHWLLGPSLSFNLLGSSTVRRGSVAADVDYSVFESTLLATWRPQRGPFARVSFGPGVASARAELSVAAGGAGFRDLAVSETKPELALEVTVLPRSMKIVAPGLELGLRVIPVTQGTWTMFSARFAIDF